MTSQTDEHFATFVRARSGDLVAIGTHLTGDREQARDLAQTALERAWRNWGRLDPELDPFPYVRQILVNAHLDAWRRMRLRRFFSADEDRFAAIPDDAPTPAEQVESAARARALLAPLQPRERACLVLRYFEDLSEAETALELGLPVGTVKSTTSRALAKLRVSEGNHHEH